MARSTATIGSSLLRGAQAAWEASCASGDLWHAARPVLHLPQWRLVVQEAVSGQQFRHWLAELTHEEAGEAELQRVEQHLKLIAGARSLVVCASAWSNPTSTSCGRDKGKTWDIWATGIRSWPPRLPTSVTSYGLGAGALQPHHAFAPATSRMGMCSSVSRALAL